MVKDLRSICVDRVTLWWKLKLQARWKVFELFLMEIRSQYPGMVQNKNEIINFPLSLWIWTYFNQSEPGQCKLTHYRNNFMKRGNLIGGQFCKRILCHLNCSMMIHNNNQLTFVGNKID